MSCYSILPVFPEKDDRMYLLDLMLPDSMDSDGPDTLDPRLQQGFLSSPDLLNSLVPPQDFLADANSPFPNMVQPWDHSNLRLGEPMLSPSCPTSYHRSSTPLSQTLSSVCGEAGFAGAYSQPSPDIHGSIDFLSPAPSYTLSSQAAILHSPASNGLIDPNETQLRRPSPAASSIFEFGQNGDDGTEDLSEQHHCLGSPYSLDLQDLELAPAPPLGSARAARDQSPYPRSKAETIKKSSTNNNNGRAKNQTPDRRRRRRRPQRAQQDLVKPRAIRKNNPNTYHQGSLSSRLTCMICTARYEDLDSLEDHIRLEHNRPFTCIFHHAGCQSSFTTKNEWKRHVNVQHLQAHYYLCTHGSCARFQHKDDKRGVIGAAGGSSRSNLAPTVTLTPGPGKMFSRKDLFDSHVKRMHYTKEETKSNPEWNDKIRRLRAAATWMRYTPPLHMDCPAHDCYSVFIGARAWEDRMEHIAEHMENAVSGLEPPVRFGPQNDAALWAWASSREIGIVGRTPSGWALCMRVPSLTDTPLVQAP